MDYRESGVNIDAGNEVVRRIKGLARATFTPGVLSELGSFGGLFHLGARARRDPVLVSSADGVGTKLRLAFMSGIHGTIGADLVNHCVNDILVQGAEPLFFLDYLATGRLDPDVAVQIVEGLARACRENGCALLGGETAEMPGFYADGEYDVAGFIVGAVERDRLIDGRQQAAGGQVVEEEQRLGALHEDVVDAVIDEIGADRVMTPGHERDLQLRADAVGARHQHRITIAIGVQPEKAAERADVRQYARSEGASRDRLDPADGFVAGIDVDPGLPIVGRRRWRVALQKSSFPISVCVSARAGDLSAAPQ